MMSKVGSTSVTASPQVGQNQRPIDANKAFTVSWSRTTATINQTIGISGIAHIKVDNPALLSVQILFNKLPYKSAENIVVGEKGAITAQWKVTPYQYGNFTAGTYDVEIRYGGGFLGKTTTPLKIVAAGSAAGHHAGASTFGR
jgi:hypothetical protein